MPKQLVSRIRSLARRVAERPGASASAAILFAPRAARLILRSFVEDRCLLLASSLSYTTVLSIVPFLAVAFSISTAFGIQNTSYIRDLLMSLTAERTQVVETIIDYINNTNVSTLGALGTAILIFTAVSLLRTIETTLNIIWGVEEQVGFWRKFSSYASLILVGPLFIIAAFSVTATLQSTAMFRQILGLPLLGLAYAQFLRVLPMLLIWTALFSLYKFLPSTRVRVTSALAGALSGGTLWYLTELLYIRYQFGVSGYNAVYGSFAQIPILLAWLYLSWVIVLLGAEVSHFIQTYRTFDQEVQADHYSHADREMLAILVFLLLTRNFQTGEAPTPGEVMADAFDAPVKLVGSLLRLFAERRMVARVEGEAGRETYILARPPASITLGGILDVLASDREGVDIEVTFDRRYPFVRDIHAELARDARQVRGQTLEELHERYGQTLGGLVRQELEARVSGKSEA